MLKEGDIIELKEGHIVNCEVPEHYVYANRVGSFKNTKTSVVIGNFNGLDTMFLEGKYVVVKTTFDGGGTGHGDHDTYPDGHHVWCEKMDESKINIDFYQSGCFYALIKDIIPIGKAERTWKEKVI